VRPHPDADAALDSAASDAFAKVFREDHQILVYSVSMTRNLIGSLLAVAGLSAAQSPQTFTGTITDDMCFRADHSQMKMGPTDADCVKACIAAHAASYVLFDGKGVYVLSDQKTPENFAAQKVTVVGTLDDKTKTIHVQSIAAAK
jgi:hypothetical protein